MTKCYCEHYWPCQWCLTLNPNLKQDLFDEMMKEKKMKRTKTIDVVVEKDWIKESGRVGLLTTDSKFEMRINGKDTIKAKLVIEIPERSATLTESELATLLKEARTKTPPKPVSVDELAEAVFDEIDRRF